MSHTALHSFAFGLATKNAAGEIIEVYYPSPVIQPNADLSSLLSSVCKIEPGSNCTVAIDGDLQVALFAALDNASHTELAEQLRTLCGSGQHTVICILSKDIAPASIPEAYLKLHLLSHRLAKPHSLNLQGIFAVLRNLAWTNQGAIDLPELPARQLQARMEGKVLEVMSVDKFPKMTSYVVPSGVRIAHTARVRLGAYLGSGTTVMHEGFVNFNAGTLGAAMIEGRISAGVVVGEHSDLGGGCSTMGTLSGGGTEIISVGKNCLIGANAGIGIPLADGCIVEAGLYVTAGTKVKVLDAQGTLTRTVKARELANTTHLLFRRNSLNGAVECVPLKRSVDLNDELHSHN